MTHTLINMLRNVHIDLLSHIFFTKGGVHSLMLFDGFTTSVKKLLAVVFELNLNSKLNDTTI